jgi:hypothetical protein
MTVEHPGSQEHEQEREQPDARAGSAGTSLILLRYVLPAVIVLAGLIVMMFGSNVDLEGGASIISAGLALFAISWLYRASFDGDRERDEEEAARAYFSRHGHWPDESPAPQVRKSRADGPAPRKG